MNKTVGQEFKELLKKEQQFRKEWQAAVKVLENLVQPVTDHNLYCVNFWVNHFSTHDEIILQTTEGHSYKIVKPIREAAEVRTVLPYGIDYSTCQLLNLDSD